MESSPPSLTLGHVAYFVLLQITGPSQPLHVTEVTLDSPAPVNLPYDGSHKSDSRLRELTNPIQCGWSPNYSPSNSSANKMAATSNHYVLEWPVKQKSITDPVSYT